MIEDEENDEFEIPIEIHENEVAYDPQNADEPQNKEKSHTKQDNNMKNNNVPETLEPKVEKQEARNEEEINNSDDENYDENDKQSFLYIKGRDMDITSVSAYRAVQQIEEALRRKPTVIKINQCQLVQLGLRVHCNNREE